MAPIAVKGAVQIMVAKEIATPRLTLHCVHAITIVLHHQAPPHQRLAMQAKVHAVPRATLHAVMQNVQQYIVVEQGFALILVAFIRVSANTVVD